MKSTLHHWFIKNRRDLPWRENLHKPYFRDPYSTWISEIMLQQTRVNAVIEHYTNWMHSFPSIQILAQSHEETVLQHWRGLGYYSRAKNIFKTAKIIANDFNGVFPKTRSELLKLPGIGEYSAGAILSLSMNLPEYILDGNCVRVFSRLHCLNFLPEKKEQKNIYQDLAKKWVQQGIPQIQNEALMELGAMVCTPQNPLCEQCPLQKKCSAFKNKQQNKFPPNRKKQRPQKIFGIAYVYKSPKGFLLVQSDNQKFLKSHFGFPIQWSEKRNTSFIENNNDSLLSKCIKHSITHYHIELSVVLCSQMPPIDIYETQKYIAEKNIHSVLHSGLHQKIFKAWKTLHSNKSGSKKTI